MLTQYADKLLGILLLRQDLRWGTEPDLRFDSPAERLDLVPLPVDSELPLPVEQMSGWFGTGSYQDVFALAFVGDGREVVLATTDDGDLLCTTRETAVQRAEVVAANMRLQLTEEHLTS
jgi:hypothetical protein